ncbi:MAG: hypothetical protein OXI49_03870 [Acidobacteriota bacterium]|nr:hypothetical protein [Acidobacteriota bacterium]
MTAPTAVERSRVTLDLDTFWNWLVLHPNCVIRAGSVDALLCDDEDFHWHFVAEENSLLIAQLVYGKRLVGEILIDRERVVYVQSFQGEHGNEYVFELISETESECLAAWVFVMSHGLDDEPQESAHATPSLVH